MPGKLTSEEMFKSELKFYGSLMKKVRVSDEAVSPIIATILLVAITVTILATAYTIFSGYIPTSSPEGPSLEIIYTNDTHLSSGLASGNYVMTLSEISNNMSVRDLSIQVVLQNGSIFSQPMYDSYILGNATPVSPHLYLNVSMPGGYLSSNGYIVLSLSGSSVFPSVLSIVDSSSGNRVATVSF